MGSDVFWPIIHSIISFVVVNCRCLFFIRIQYSEQKGIVLSLPHILLLFLLHRDRVLQSSTSIWVSEADRGVYQQQPGTNDEHYYWQSKTSAKRQETEITTVQEIPSPYLRQTLHRISGVNDGHWCWISAHMVAAAAHILTTACLFYRILNKWSVS